MKYLKLSNLILTVLAVVAGLRPFNSLGQGNTASQSNILDSTAKVLPFAPGIVNTRYDEEATSFSPDNKTVYFFMGSVYPTICYSQNINGQWTTPQVASFSGKWSEMDPFVSPDGKKLFFTSNRPLPGAPQNAANKRFELWYADNIGADNWGEPHHLDAPVNTGNESNFAPSVDGKGTLYWCAWDREGNKGVQGYYSTWLGDHYEKAKLLTIAGVSNIHDPFVAANGKYLVCFSGKDIYVSFADKDGWQTAQKLGRPVNTGDDLNSPYVSHDGKMLYFSSGRLKGFYKRNPENPALSYDELVKENDNLFNGSGNILMVPVNLPDGR